MPRPSTLYLHCGLHKTGTTSLQAALAASYGRLREAGALYPLAGRYSLEGRAVGDDGANHHNIAYQLARGRDFDHRRGDLGALFREVANFDGDVILSSEDFEWFLEDLVALARIQNLADLTNRRLVIIVYLRNQIDYCESLFLEMLKHGGAEDYREHANAILRSGRSETRDWVIQFDYERMLNGLAGQTGFDLIVRNFHDLVDRSIFADFASITGLGEALKPSPGEENSNRRLTPSSSLGHFYRNRRKLRMTAVQRARLRHLAERVANPVTGRSLQQRFVERFAEGNRRVCAQWRLDPKGLDMADRPSRETSPTFEQFFSFEMQCLVESGQLPSGLVGDDAPGLDGWTSGVDPATLELRLKERLADQYWLIAKLLNNLNPYAAGRG
jgi:hypothetical protein